MTLDVVRALPSLPHGERCVTPLPLVPAEAGHGRGGRLRDLHAPLPGHAAGQGQRGGLHRAAV